MVGAHNDRPRQGQTTEGSQNMDEAKYKKYTSNSTPHPHQPLGEVSPTAITSLHLITKFCYSPKRWCGNTQLCRWQEQQCNRLPRPQANQSIPPPRGELTNGFPKEPKTNKPDIWIFPHMVGGVGEGRGSLVFAYFVSNHPEVWRKGTRNASQSGGVTRWTRAAHRAIRTLSGQVAQPLAV